MQDRDTGPGTAAGAGPDLQPVLAAGVLRLRPLQAEDLPALTAAAADPEIWAQHPASDRGDPAIFAPYARWLLAAGGTLLIEERETARVIGCSRFYQTPDIAPDWAIGFTFLVRDHWGGATNAAVKAAMLDHLFAHVPRVWFHIAPGNHRSLRATAKIGARRVLPDIPVDIGFGPAPTARMCLGRSDWATASTASPANRPTGA